MSRSAFDRGVDAAILRNEYAEVTEPPANPYPLGTAEHTNWIEGYNVASDRWINRLLQEYRR